MTDRALCPDVAAAVRAAVRGGVDWVQVRARELDGRALLAHVEEVTRAARLGAGERGGAVAVLVNRRVDVALAAGADGVHLGFDAVPAAVARALLGPEAIVGISTHSAEEVLDTADGGAVSYAQLAPIARPLSKAATRPELGFAALSEAAAAGLPVLAQGGMDADGARRAVRAGAAGVAVTGAVLAATHPEEAAATLRAALDAATGEVQTDRRPGR